MKLSLIRNAAPAAAAPVAAAAASPQRLACPLCSGHLRQTQSRFIDTLTGYFLLAQRARFCCRALGCGWEGNLRVRSQPGMNRGGYDERKQVLAPSLMGSVGASSRQAR